MVEAVASILGNSSGMCDVLVCMDNDDPVRGWVQLPHVTCLRGPHLSFCQWVNAGVKAFLHDYYVFAWGADDVRYTTPGWDELVLQHLTEKDQMIYGPDGIQDEKLPTHPFIGCGVPRALGYLIQPNLKHYFADNWVQRLGARTGKLKYVPELVIQHQHHSRNPTKIDLVYQEAEKHYQHDVTAFAEGVFDEATGLDKTGDAAEQLRRWMAAQATPALRPS